MNTDNFLIDNNDIELAQSICKIIEDDNIRNRAVANAIAANIAVKYFDSEFAEIDTESGLHNIGLVLKDIDISDIYIKNNYIDVRITFNEEEIGVPEAHFKNNLLPTAYMFIKINADLSGASVIGFISPDKINCESSHNGYYRVMERELMSFYDIEPLLNSTDMEPEISDKDIFAFIDNSLTDKNTFYADLIKSRESRLKLAKAVKAKEIFRFVSIVKTDNPELVNTEDTEEPLFETLDEGFLIGADEPFELNAVTKTEDLTLDKIDEIEDLVNLELESDCLLQEQDNNNDLIILDTVIDENNSTSPQENIEIENSEAMTIDVEEIKLEQQEKEIFSTEMPIAEEPQELTLVDTGSSEEMEENNLNSDIENNENFNNTTTEENNNEIPTNYTTVISSDDDSLLDELSESENTVSTTETVSNNFNSEEQINTLFNTNSTNSNATEESSHIENNSQHKQQKGSIFPLTIIVLLIIAGVLGYYGYTKFAQQSINEDALSNDMPSDVQMQIDNSSKEEAMPVESIETTSVQVSDEGTSDTIPLIEQNLDASILVSNLKVEWEIPAGYASNTAARRYLVKLGKIIQLNLKTELLLLNKPPLTNKIAVEIKYNDNNRKFETAGVAISSGEKSVDNLVLQVVNKALGMNLSTNTDSFTKLQGNPILVIHL